MADALSNIFGGYAEAQAKFRETSKLHTSWNPQDGICPCSWCHTSRKVFTEGCEEIGNPVTGYSENRIEHGHLIEGRLNSDDYGA